MILEQCLSAHYGGPCSHSNQALAYKHEVGGTGYWSSVSQSVSCHICRSQTDNMLFVQISRLCICNAYGDVCIHIGYDFYQYFFAGSPNLCCNSICSPKFRFSNPDPEMNLHPESLHKLGRGSVVSTPAYRKVRISAWYPIGATFAEL
jgi:hypothetical protein